MKTHSEFIKLIQTAFFIFFISCSYVYSQKNDKWTYDPDNPEKIQDMGYYGRVLSSLEGKMASLR